MIALAALFVPHYLATAIGVEELRDSPWDVVVGVGVIVALAVVRLVTPAAAVRACARDRRDRVRRAPAAVLLGIPLLFDPSARRGHDLGVADPAWDELAFALPLAMLAYTGLETVANLAAEAREPGRTLPRSLFAGIGAVVAVSFCVAVVGPGGVPGRQRSRRPSATSGALHRSRASRTRIGEMPSALGDMLVFLISMSGVVVLLAAVTTSMSGAGRLTLLAGAAQHAPARASSG